ncbi:MAG: amidohydrolase family protein [Nitrospinota bacterium]
MHIDVHCHIFPEEYIDLMEREGPRYGAVIHTDENGDKHATLKGIRQPPLKPFMDPSVRMETMKEMGLDMNVLSFSSRPGVYWADPQLAEELSQEANNGYARIIKENPDRFSGLATLPAQDAERSVRELERAVTKLGLKGGFMGTNVNGRYLDDEGFFPIYEAAAALKVPIIVHPANPAAMSEMRDYHLFNLIGFTTESANSIARLIFSGIFDRLPDLQFIFLHGGGTAPILAGRFIHGWEVRPECQKIKRSPLEYMRSHFYFDALVFHPPIVRFLVDLMGSDRIMLGTDLAYDMTDTNIVQTLESAGLSDEEYAQITHLNAEELFGL